MSNRLIFALLLTATLYATAASLISLSSPAGRGVPIQVYQSAPAADIPVLPAVVVRADRPPTLLPSVTVTASPEEIAAAMAASDVPLAGTAVASRRVVAGSLLSNPGFGMPYYSFGKSAYRVNKE